MRLSLKSTKKGKNELYFFLLQLERWFFDKRTLLAIKVLSSNTKTDKSDDD